MTTGVLRTVAASWMVLVAALVATIARADEFTLHSPDKRLVLLIDAGDQLTWSAAADDRTIIAPSQLGMELADGPMPNGAVQLIREDVSTHDETWDWRFGAASRIRDHYREAVLTLRETRADGRTFQLVLRAYDDG